jgi:DNA-binding PadR family transcriptional regulator
MSDLKLTPTLVAMLERIEQHSGALLMLAVTASGGAEYGKLNKLRGAGYVVKCDHPSVTEGPWPAEALAITEAGRAALAKHRAETTEKKEHRRPGDKRVIFRRDGERYIVFLGDDRIGFVRRADNGTWNHVDTTMAHSGHAKTRERAGQLLRRRYERMVREGVI